MGGPILGRHRGKRFAEKMSGGREGMNGYIKMERLMSDDPQMRKRRLMMIRLRWYGHV